MAIKVYLKKGNLNYKERRYIAAIQKNLEAKGIKAQDFNPATNFSELEELHNTYGAEEIEFEEIEEAEIKSDSTSAQGDIDTTDDYEKHKEFRDSMVAEKNSDAPPNDSIVDPFNKAEPIVRDYVKSGGLEDPNEPKKTNQTTFNEPTTWGDSFQLPSGEGGTSISGGGSNSGGNNKKSSSSLSGGKKDSEKPKTPPLNEALEGVSQARKRKSTKKMATAIVYGVCKLAEFGCVYWVTKDITEDKLIEYEINDTMDLQMLLALDENQQITVRNWFAMQVKNANNELRVTEAEKRDMADSLYEVLLEKGIAPTPTQELMIDAVGALVMGLGLKAFAMQKQIASVLAQLTAMRKEQKEQGINRNNIGNNAQQNTQEEEQPIEQEQNESQTINTDTVEDWSTEEALILNDSEKFESDITDITLIEE
jgi:hypothetical protein